MKTQNKQTPRRKDAPRAKTHSAAKRFTMAPPAAGEKPIRAGTAGAARAILAAATITLAAGAAPAADGSVKIHGVALSGEQLRPRGYDGPVVIDLDGLRAGKSIPLQADHEDRLESMLGQATVLAGEGGTLAIEGLIVPGTPKSDRAIALLKSGGSMAVSVGVRPESIEKLRPGQSAMVNGRKVKAGARGLTIVREGELHEVSLLPTGADRGAHVRIAATGALDDDDAGEGGQGEGDGLDAGAGDVAVRAAADERRRINAIRRRAAHAPDIEAQAIEGGWSAERTELEVLRRGGPRVFVPRRGIGNVQPADVLAGAIFRMVGRAADGEKMLGAAAMNASETINASGGLLGICEAALRLEGREVPHGRDQMIRASLSTSSLPVGLGNVIEKSMAADLAMNPPTYSRIAKKVPVRTFHEHKSVRMVLQGGLQEVPKDGELKHGTISETTHGVQAATYGKIIGLDRKAIINDDLGLFDSIPRLCGFEWQRKLGDLAWGVVKAAAGSFFSTGNKNLSEGTDTVLSGPGLTAAVRMLREQVDEDGRPLGLSPAVIAVPPALEATARTLLNSTEMAIFNDDGEARPTANPHKGIAELVIEPRLAAVHGGDDAAWYLFAAAYYGAVQLALLNGRETPTVEMQAASFDTLGMQWRVFGDAGAAMGEPRAAVLSTGAEAEE